MGKFGRDGRDPGGNHGARQGGPAAGLRAAAALAAAAAALVLTGFTPLLQGRWVWPAGTTPEQAVRDDAKCSHEALSIAREVEKVLPPVSFQAVLSGVQPEAKGAYESARRECIEALGYRWEQPRSLDDLRVTPGKQ